MFYSSTVRSLTSHPQQPAHPQVTPSVLDKFQASFRERYANEPEFLQAHSEVLQSLRPLFVKAPHYFELFKILSEPERIVQFRVIWQDDGGALRCNRAYRVQFNSALGPYKGGLRLHPSVNLSVLKFLGFEQIFKNALTGLQMGGGKGGSDFDPKDKSDMEVRSFCQAFMTELSRHIGNEVDVPAGDIGTGAREIGYLYGQYHKIKNCHHGVLTGKGVSWGGSHIRPEATGYGAVYFAQNLYKHFLNSELTGRLCLVSGAGNAAQYTCEKLIDCGAKVLSVSDVGGSLFFPNGMTREDLQDILALKNQRRESLSSYQGHNAKYFDKVQPWFLDTDCEIAFPAATQNELLTPEVESLQQKPSFKAVVEVANMPTTPEAIRLLHDKGNFFCPGKAANAGGVAVSGLEMSQNASLLTWSRDQVDQRLKVLMTQIFEQCVKYANEYGRNDRDLETGANIAGFLRVADAMLDQGLF